MISAAYQSLIEAGAIIGDPAQEKAAQALGAFAQTLNQKPKTGMLGRLKKSKPKAATGLYLYGSVGRGKTMLMDLLVKSLNDKHVRRVHFHAFMLEVHARLNVLRKQGVDDDFIAQLAADIGKDTRLLCFDELHVNDIADAMILGPLFKALMESGINIVTTSNYPPDELYKDGLQRARFLPFIEFIKTHMRIVYLDSPTDYRMRALSEQGTWFTPLNDQSWERMTALFETLTDHKPTSPTRLEIGGRGLDVVKADSKRAWLDFDTLCRQNRGASDYLALGHSFEAVFIDNVPRMNEDNRNEARRFMTLIDALYDLKRVVVVRAATPPQNLYTGTSHEFEFARTLSRLIEMQSPEWLKAHDTV